MASDDFDLIVGIDFGTTGSGVGYCFNKPGARVANMLKYARAERQSNDSSRVSNPKVPSILAYVKDNPHLESTAWGFEADNPSCHLAAWFKLFFQKRIDIAKWHSSDQEWAFTRGIMHLPQGKTPTDLVSDFLRYLLEYFMITVGPELAAQGKNWNATKIKFCFTVPVVWSLEATNEMASAIENACIGTRPNDRVYFLTEAEAAMTLLLSKRLTSSSSRNPEYEIFKPGNRVIICDCGGGTVDIASYLIGAGENSYEELAGSSGGPYGSTFVDRAFYRLMIKRFGIIFSDLPPQEIGPKSPFMKEFDEVKCSFTGLDHSKVYKLHLAMLVDDVPGIWYRQPKSKVLISSADMQEMFHGAVKEIIMLLQDQIEKTDEREGHAPLEAYKIVLVGGFACSSYLQTELKRAFELECNGRLRMVHYMHGNMFTAVTLGAVKWGTEVFRSKSLILNCHYGVRSFFPVDLLHDQGLLAISNVDFYVDTQNVPTHWIAEKDQKLELGNPIRQDGLLCHREGDSMNKTLNIYGSDEDPPTIEVHGPGTVILARVNLGISSIDLSRCQLHQVQGRIIWSIDYQLSVALTECGRRLRYAVASQGIEIGHRIGRPGIIDPRC